jgi:hypothetical protein
MSLTPEEIEEIATKAARAAIHEAREDVTHLIQQTVAQTLTQIGIESKEPIEMQKDFQHLRSWRQSGEAVKRQGMLTVWGIFLSGLIGLVVMGLSAYFGHQKP